MGEHTLARSEAYTDRYGYDIRGPFPYPSTAHTYDLEFGRQIVAALGLAEHMLTEPKMTSANVHDLRRLGEWGDDLDRLVRAYRASKNGGGA